MTIHIEAGTAGRYVPGSTFESCPAATGQARCPHFPDGAHRCGQDRDHVAADDRPAIEHTHRCTCGAQWCSLSGSVDELIKLSVESALRYALAGSTDSTPTDWAETARDLISNDPERIARHLPALPAPTDGEETRGES